MLEGRQILPFENRIWSFMAPIEEDPVESRVQVCCFEDIRITDKTREMRRLRRWRWLSLELLQSRFNEFCDFTDRLLLTGTALLNCCFENYFPIDFPIRFLSFLLSPFVEEVLCLMAFEGRNMLQLVVDRKLLGYPCGLT